MGLVEIDPQGIGLESLYEPADLGTAYPTANMNRHLARSAKLTLDLANAPEKAAPYLSEETREILKQLAADDLEWLAQNP